MLGVGAWGRGFFSCAEVGSKVHVNLDKCSQFLKNLLGVVVDPMKRNLWLRHLVVFILHFCFPLLVGFLIGGARPRKFPAHLLELGTMLGGTHFDGWRGGR